jgi:ATP-dependent DNA helicase RecG
LAFNAIVLGWIVVVIVDRVPKAESGLSTMHSAHCAGQMASRLAIESSRVEDILNGLMATRATDLESQTLEFKTRGKDEKDFSRHLEEATVCLANADGGLVIFGVDDKKIGRAAFDTCRFGPVRADWVRSRIGQLTKPPVKCSLARASDVVANLPCAEARDLIIIEVFKRTSPTGHSTHDRVSYVRVDKECLQYRIGDEDFTKGSLEHLDDRNLDWTSVEDTVRQREARSGELTELGHQSRDYLLEAGLLRISDHLGSRGDAQYFLSAAGLLLFGTEKSISTEFPAAQTVVAVEGPGNRPLTYMSSSNVASAIGRTIKLIQQHIPRSEPLLPDLVLRELLVNAYLHRCYRTQAAIQIDVRPGEIEIQNPGGLLGSLTLDALLYAPSIYRNGLLAEAARQFALCDKVGHGINMVYQNSIIYGFDFPLLKADHDTFSVIVNTIPDKPFASFIRDFASVLMLNLTELIVLRELRSRQRAGFAKLSARAQRPPEIMEKVLSGLQKRMIIDQRGDEYLLSDPSISQLARYGESGQLKLL